MRVLWRRHLSVQWARKEPGPISIKVKARIYTDSTLGLYIIVEYLLNSSALLQWK